VVVEKQRAEGWGEGGGLAVFHFYTLSSRSLYQLLNWLFYEFLQLRTFVLSEFFSDHFWQIILAIRY